MAVAFGIGGAHLAREILQKSYNRSNQATSGSSSSRHAGTAASGSVQEEGERPQVYRLRYDEP